MPGGQPLHQALLPRQAAQDPGGKPGSHSCYTGDPKKPIGDPCHIQPSQVTGGAGGGGGGAGEGELSTILPQVLPQPKEILREQP